MAPRKKAPPKKRTAKKAPINPRKDKRCKPSGTARKKTWKRFQLPIGKGAPEKFQPQQIIDALHANRGRIYRTAASLDCAACTVKRYIAEYPEVAQAVHDARGMRLDVAETKLDKLVRQNNLGAICFILKCLGKDRGYIERLQTEMSGPDGKPIESHITGSGPDFVATRLLELAERLRARLAPGGAEPARNAAANMDAP